MSGCASLQLRTWLWDLKLRLNFYHLNATSPFEYMGRFGIALYICMGLSFYRAQINIQSSAQ